LKQVTYNVPSGVTFGVEMELCFPHSKSRIEEALSEVQAGWRCVGSSVTLQLAVQSLLLKSNFLAILFHTIADQLA
jgi:hypothetical protein